MFIPAATLTIRRGCNAAVDASVVEPIDCGPSGLPRVNGARGVTPDDPFVVGAIADTPEFVEDTPDVANDDEPDARKFEFMLGAPTETVSASVATDA